MFSLVLYLLEVLTNANNSIWVSSGITLLTSATHQTPPTLQCRETAWAHCAQIVIATDSMIIIIKSVDMNHDSCLSCNENLCSFSQVCHATLKILNISAYVLVDLTSKYLNSSISAFANLASQHRGLLHCNDLWCQELNCVTSGTQELTEPGPRWSRTVLTWKKFPWSYLPCHT